MGDSRFRLNGEFEIYGQKYDMGMSMNWFDDGDGIDHSILTFFRDSYRDARAKFDHEMLVSQRAEREKAAEAQERAQLKHLLDKYGRDLP